MQGNEQKMAVVSSRRVMLVLMSLSTLYAFIYCTMLSGALHMLPVFGGAMFLFGRVAVTLSDWLLGGGRKYLTVGMQWLFGILLGLMLLCTLALISFSPFLLSSPSVWVVFSCVLAIFLRNAFARRLTARRMRRTIGKQAYRIAMALWMLVPIGVMAALFFSQMNTVDAWQMLGGFAAGTLLEAYSLWRERDLLSTEDAPDDIDPETVRQMTAELHEVSAYGAFQRMHMLVLMALQLTVVLVYTFIGLTTEELFWCMLLSVLCTVVMRELSNLFLRFAKKSYAVHLLLVGLFLWLYGLALFYRQLSQETVLVWQYLSLCLAMSGLTISVSALAELEQHMTDVATFRLQDRMRGYARMRAAGTELAMLLGQMIALILLTILCIPAGAAAELDLSTLASAFRPVMAVPPLILLVAAIVSVLHFPMNNRHFQKLAKWLTLESEGTDNPALKKQLDSVVVHRHKNRFGIRIIITLLRPLYYHRVQGKENVADYEDGDMILVCNHGEIYGPVVANLYVPIAFRPWVIAHMMDKQAIVDYLYEGTMVRQKWIPERWKRPIVRMVTPLFTWVFGSLEAIPVYRGNPRELLKTFRLTLEAMQAGDNILVFPETGEKTEPGQRGFVTEGVGQMYTGFAMIAPLYYQRTGRRAVFVPIYASRRHRTLTLGKGIQFDPENNVNDEKQRIVNELMQGMQALCDAQDGASDEDASTPHPS